MTAAAQDRLTSARAKCEALVRHRVLVERTLGSTVETDSPIPLRVEGIVESWHVNANGAAYVNVRGFGDVDVLNTIDLGPWAYVT